MRWRDRNRLSGSQAQTLIALRARRQAHQIAREVLNPHIAIVRVVDQPEPPAHIELEYRAAASVDHLVAEFTTDACPSDARREAIVAAVLRARATSVSMTNDEHAARRNAPADARAVVTIFVILFLAIVMCVGLIVREFLRVL